MGLRFDNPVGLAAGFDKNGDAIGPLFQLGFGFVEVGTVTPKPQPGNPRPRLFRLRKEKALINRMGFNNKGVDYLTGRLQGKKYPGILGINLGKNKTTPLEQAVDDYLYCLDAVYPYADYVTINISSPNTPELRRLQTKEYLTDFLERLQARQAELRRQHNRQVPMAIKIDPDQSEDAIKVLAGVLLAQKVDAVIATNTTVSRDVVSASSFAHEAGGLSGRPLTSRSLQTVRWLNAAFAREIPIIASGGIDSAETAQQFLAAGASLVQIYTGLVYEGPALIQRIACCGIL